MPDIHAVLSPSSSARWLACTPSACLCAEKEDKTNPMPPTTEQAVIMLASHFYESRDGSTGGFFADNVQAGQQVFNTVNLLLRLDRNWKV